MKEIKIKVNPPKEETITPREDHIRTLMAWTKLLETNFESTDGVKKYMSYKPTEEDYRNCLEIMELDIEDELKEILNKLGFNASVKTDRKSLPYNKEITYIKRITSFVNDAYDTADFYCEVVGYLLKRDDYKKVRFYIHMEHVKIPMGTGVQLNFRWYERN